MSTYKITVVVEDENSENKRYPDTKTLYEQVVVGDETIVNAIVGTVLDYNTSLANEPMFLPSNELESSNE